MDAAARKALGSWLARALAGRRYGCLLVRGGEVAGEWWGGGFSAADRFEIGSIRKSFCSALVGIGVARGDFGYDLRGESGWPHFVAMSGDAADAEITLHDLMSASSGWLTPAPRGTEMRYNNAAFTATERVVGRHYGLEGDEIAPTVEAAFKAALGTASWTVYHMRQRALDAANIDCTGPKLAIDSTLRDLARWGELWCAGGAWEGRQLIPAEHVARATKRTNPHIPGAHYGYNWFVNDGRALWPGAPEDSFGHIGNGTFKRDEAASFASLWICPRLKAVAALVTAREGFGDSHLVVPQNGNADWIARAAPCFG